MADAPVNPHVEITPEHAEILLSRWLGRTITGCTIKPLTGGCIYTVAEISYNDFSSPVVIKASVEPHDAGLHNEYRNLVFFQEHTEFPLPRAFYLDLSCRDVPFAYFLMQRLPGSNLAEAKRWMTPNDAINIEVQMANCVADLHRHKGSHFGSIHEETGCVRWQDFFIPIFRENLEENRRQMLLSAESIRKADAIFDELDEMLEAPGEPTLVHGDIWSTNIIVDRREGRALLSGFVDGGGNYMHPEYELAYLELWKTAGDIFFDIYHRVHQPIAGYEKRRRVYWLNTLLLHVWLFKSPNYIRAADQMIKRMK